MCEVILGIVNAMPINGHGIILFSEKHQDVFRI